MRITGTWRWLMLSGLISLQLLRFPVRRRVPPTIAILPRLVNSYTSLFHWRESEAKR